MLSPIERTTPFPVYRAHLHGQAGCAIPLGPLAYFVPDQGLRILGLATDRLTLDTLLPATHAAHVRAFVSWCLGEHTP